MARLEHIFAPLAGHRGAWLRSPLAGASVERRKTLRPCEAERLVPKAALRAMRGMAQQFMRREDGTITVFAMAVFVLMVGVGGIAVDLMRFEAQRSQLQSTLDRAVLAAASLNQQRDAEGVVRNYFETAGFENYRLSVDVERNINFRRVAVEAEVDVQTLFMKLFGQRVLTSFASGAAEERIPKVEVSLVLDISGSMMFLDRMTNLKPAAREFVTSILEANDNPNNNQLVSLSIVPYSGHVNMGTTIASVFALTNEHNYSRCARFDWSHFTVSGLDPSVPLQRMAHLDWWDNRIDAPDPVDGRYTCQRDNAASILPWSNDEAALHALIDSLQADGTTAIDAGMRWGVALLDPMAVPALNTLVGRGVVHSDFTNRPAAYDDLETIKVVVLMTDGENAPQYDVVPRYRSGPSRFWRDPDDGSLSVHYPEWNQYWHEDTAQWATTPDGGHNNNAVRLDYADFWNHIPAALVRFRLFNWPAWTGLEINRAWHVFYSGVEFDFWNIVNMYVDGHAGDNRLRQICDVARQNDIVVFSIAFQAPPQGQAVMRYCATTDAHYYPVQNANISDAFTSIARTISQLRLVQ